MHNFTPHCGSFGRREERGFGTSQKGNVSQRRHRECWEVPLVRVSGDGL